MFTRRRDRLYATYVLVMDALGFANRIREADEESLFRLWDEIERQYSQFRTKIPNFFVMKIGKRLFLGTREMETLRLNDMFVTFSRKRIVDPDIRYLVSASLLYHQMLLEGFIPRGGLGFGLIARGEGLLIGNGFIDAYDCAEKRSTAFKDICAIEISPNAMQTIRPTQRRYQLICFFQGGFFIHPYFLIDPEMGEFNRNRILECLRNAGANEQKLGATAAFLDGFEDWKQAEGFDSQSRKFKAEAASSMLKDPKAH